MKQYNYKPDREIRDTAIVYQIIIVILMLVVLGLASWLGGVKYSRHACLVTTGDEQCNQQ